MTLIRRGSGDSGATVVEFALVVPMLIMLLFGILEVGRLVTTYALVTTASREAARYGSAVGPIEGGGLPQYEDCEGMEERAERWIIIGSPDPVAIEYFEAGVLESFTTCPDPASVLEGHAVAVTVTVPFEWVIPFTDGLEVDITATHKRTIGGQAAP